VLSVQLTVFLVQTMLLTPMDVLSVLMDTTWVVLREPTVPRAQLWMPWLFTVLAPKTTLA